MTDVCRRFVVTGKVQGVFYRASVAREAEQLGLRGWARNLANGHVEVVAVGPIERVCSLEDFLRVGPPRARVDEVSSVEAPATEFADLEDFRTC